MKLMIVESPGKVEKITQILATIEPKVKWRVEASVGHVRDLPSTGQEEGDITTGVRADFSPIYEFTERGKRVVTNLKHAIAQAELVYLATDPDREGESISWHLKESLGLKNPIRISFGEITDTKIREALSNPRRIDMKRVSAQEARRVLDRLVGYLVSSELKRQTGERLSAGRVQSVAVYLVVLREREITKFQVTTHFGVRLTFAGNRPEETWSADWITGHGFISPEQPYILDKHLADQVAKINHLLVLSFDEREALRNPPPPFKTTTLQKAASNSLGYDPDITMELAQKLYEKGHITYHRTDNPNVSEESMVDIREVAKRLGLDVVSSRREFKAGEDAQEGHAGITPTHWDIEDAGDSIEQRQLYQLIRIRALASQLLAARYKVRTVILESLEPVNGTLVRFSAKGRTIAYPGWLKLLPGDAAEEQSDDEASFTNPVPYFASGETIHVSEGTLLEKKTKAPARYTKASLIDALESKGIGRPSTYASIWANISERGYVDIFNKRFIQPTAMGNLVIDRLENKFAFLDVGFTRAMEAGLDDIAKGSTTYKSLIEQMHLGLVSDLKKQQTQITTFQKSIQTFPCPECEKPLRFIAKGAAGPFWGCTGYPECTVTLPDAKGKPGVRSDVKLTDFKCHKCDKSLVHRHKKGKGGYDFWGCSNFSNGCKQTYSNVKGKPDYASSK